MIGSVVMLTIVSSVAGWTSGAGMLIAGRSLQSVGAGGTNMLIELIICDFVPLRERSKFLSIIRGMFTVGITTGPFLGGVIAQSAGWRVGPFPTSSPFSKSTTTKNPPSAKN